MKIIISSLISLVSIAGFAANAPTFGTSYPKFQGGHPEIVWAAPTNQWREALWVYQVTPQHFPAAAVSNFMAMGGLTMTNEIGHFGQVTDTNEDGLFFRSDSTDLTIVPEHGRFDYADQHAEAKMNDKETKQPEPVVGLPEDSQLEGLGLALLEPFGIGRDDLAQRADGRLLTFGSKTSRGYYDKEKKRYVEDEATLRGIYFNRRVDGVNFAGIGIAGGCEIEYGNHARIARFELEWRNLKPYERYQTLTPEGIIQSIRDGQAVLTRKNHVAAILVKTLTITEVSPLYMGENRNNKQDFVYPFAKVECQASMDETNIDIQLYCPILSSNRVK